jgi:hypothetical protein
MKRPAGLTVIAVLMICAAALLSLGSLVSFFIAGMGITEGISADAASAAIIGMGLGGGFSLLILAAAAVGLANGVFRMREWAWSVSIVWIGAGVAFTLISLFAVRGYGLFPVGLLVVATAAWMLAYLLQPKVKRVFGALNGTSNTPSFERRWLRRAA